MGKLFENFIKADEILQILHKDVDLSEYSFGFEETNIEEDLRYRLYFQKKSKNSETKTIHNTSITIGVEEGIEKSQLPSLIKILKDNIQIKKHYKKL